MRVRVRVSKVLLDGRIESSPLQGCTGDADQRRALRHLRVVVVVVVLVVVNLVPVRASK